LISILRYQSRIVEAFRTGRGFEWADNDLDVFEGQARLNGSQYRANLVDNWIPALTDAEDKLRSPEGATVADIGCGYGISTTIMAEAYPNSSFVGVDYHEPSVVKARQIAAEHGIDDEGRLRFVSAPAENFPADGRYDLVTFFDCFHDMGNPYAVARHVKDALRPDGSLMLVEMASGDRIEDNIMSPVGTNGYAGSIFVCLPTAFAQMEKSGRFDFRLDRAEMDTLPLGGMVGEKTLERLLRSSGFTRFRCALKDEYNMILEAKP
jgi:2-polyprenyl-3-methyl-5-hydroxy-6-metoxy-1,4-benzoquinol methylase